MKKEDLLCISKGIGKMENIKSISTNTLTNDFCKKMHSTTNTLIICGHCYSYEGLEMARFPNQVKALQRNSDILSKKELSEREIYQNYMFNDNIFRLQSHGDLINELHLKNLMAIVKANKWTTFALWTKRKNVIKEYFDKHEKPENLIEAVKTNGRPKNLPKITVIKSNRV